MTVNLQLLKPSVIPIQGLVEDYLLEKVVSKRIFLAILIAVVVLLVAVVTDLGKNHPCHILLILDFFSISVFTYFLNET